MRLAGVDLNLLTALDALLEDRHVTRAARRVGVSQPAMSHSLRRLRELLGDPLLVRTARGMEATPRAGELRPAVRAALEAAAVVLQAAPAFDPRAERTFTVATADQPALQLLPPLIARIAERAPGVAIQLRTVPIDITTALAEGGLDLVIGVFGDAPAQTRTELLWADGFLSVVRRGGPDTRGPFTLARFLARPHLLVAPGGRPGSVVDDLLAQRGLARRVAVTVPHFLLAPALVAASALVWTAPATFARTVARRYPLAVRPPPLAIPAFAIAMRWHVRVDRDPGLAWLREQLRAVAP